MNSDRKVLSRVLKASSREYTVIKTILLAVDLGVYTSPFITARSEPLKAL